MVSIPSLMPVGRPLPQRTAKALVFTSGGTRVGTWTHFTNEPRFSASSRSQQESVEYRLPLPLGYSDAPNEIATLETVKLGNRVDLYVSSWRTLANLQFDAGIGGGRAGTGVTDLSRLVWTGTINAIGWQPAGVRVVCSGGTPPTSGAGTTHIIPRAALLDYDLEVSTYVSGITYTGWALIDGALYDIDAVRVGDTMRVNPARQFNVGDTSRYNAYEDANRTIASLEWSFSRLRVTFDTPQRDLIMDYLQKIAPIAITDPPPGAIDKMTMTAQVEATGGIVTKVKAGTPSDADLVAPQNGAIIVDSVGSKIWVRIGGAWVGVVVS